MDTSNVSGNRPVTRLLSQTANAGEQRIVTVAPQLLFLGQNIDNSKKTRIALSILALSALVVAGHMLKGLDYSEIERGIRDSLHIVVFAVFAAIIFEIFRSIGTVKSVLVTLILVSVVGGTAEVLQSSAGKPLNPDDLIRDILGAGAAILARLMWRWSKKRDMSMFSRLSARLGSLLVGLAILMPLAYWLAVVALNRSTFPVILGFDRWWEQHIFYEVNATTANIRRTHSSSIGNGSAIEITLSEWGRSGIGILPKANNWSNYSHLAFVASMVRGPDTSVTVRINDSNRKHQFADQFISRITVTAEPQVFRIPFTGMIIHEGLPAMDLRDIQELIIFARDKRPGTIMMLDDIRVELNSESAQE